MRPYGSHTCKERQVNIMLVCRVVWALYEIVMAWREATSLSENVTLQLKPSFYALYCHHERAYYLAIRHSHLCERIERKKRVSIPRGRGGWFSEALKFLETKGVLSVLTRKEFEEFCNKMNVDRLKAYFPQSEKDGEIVYAYRVGRREEALRFVRRNEKLVLVPVRKELSPESQTCLEDFYKICRMVEKLLDG